MALDLQQLARVRIYQENLNASVEPGTADNIAAPAESARRTPIALAARRLCIAHDGMHTSPKIQSKQ